MISSTAQTAPHAPAIISVLRYKSGFTGVFVEVPSDKI